MKCLFLIQGHEVPSSRYRVLQYLPAWKAAGHEAVVMEHEEALRDPKKALKEAHLSDVVFVHRKRLRSAFLRKLRHAAGRLVYDVDDAVMFRDALKPGRAKSLTRRFQYNRTVKLMDTVIVGNSFIQKHTPVKSHVLPTVIDLEKYRHVWEQPESVDPTLVWIGDGGSLHYLESLKPVLEEVGQRIEGCKLKIICNRFFKLNNMEVLDVPWSADSEAEELADSQVGLMPLGLDPWSQGKCALKFLQYLAVGRPAVVTPAGMNADILEQADVSRAASNPAQWVERLVALLRDEELRERFGQTGLQLVKQKYALRARAKDFVSLVSQGR